MIEPLARREPSQASDPATADAATASPTVAPSVSRSSSPSSSPSSGGFPGSWIRGFQPSTTLFWGVHVAALIGAVVCFSWWGPLLAIGCYFVRMVIVTAAYHRYFSHRAFKTSRAFQFLLALGAQSSAQKGVLWWAGHHRHHHKHSDTAADIHSARRSGFWHSHIGWILVSDWDATNYDQVADLAKFPELRVLNHSAVMMLPAVALGAAFYFLGGWQVFVWGFLVSNVLLWHGSFSINSLSHLYGKRRYETSDDSRNNWLLAIITTGEGWHNNHHHYQSSANQGFRWWEIDVTFYVLRVLALFGLVWDLRRPSPAVIAGTASA